MKTPSLNPWRTCCVQKLFRTFRTIFVHNMFSPCFAKRRASDKDLLVVLTSIGSACSIMVSIKKWIMWKQISTNLFQKLVNVSSHDFTKITTSLICSFLAIFLSKHLKSSWEFYKNMWYCTEQITDHKKWICTLQSRQRAFFYNFGNKHGLWMPNAMRTLELVQPFLPHWNFEILGGFLLVM